jgi:hypothetical protein
MTRSNFYAAGLVVLLMAIAANTVLVLSNIEQVRSDEAHTRKVQVQGGPPAKCLLEVMEHVAPLLERAPSVEHPLNVYVAIQRSRYPSAHCPDRRSGNRPVDKWPSDFKGRRNGD